MSSSSSSSSSSTTQTEEPNSAQLLAALAASISHRPLPPTVTQAQLDAHMAAFNPIGTLTFDTPEDREAIAKILFPNGIKRLEDQPPIKPPYPNGPVIFQSEEEQLVALAANTRASEELRLHWERDAKEVTELENQTIAQEEAEAVRHICHTLHDVRMK